VFPFLHRPAAAFVRNSPPQRQETQRHRGHGVARKLAVGVQGWTLNDLGFCSHQASGSRPSILRTRANSGSLCPLTTSSADNPWSSSSGG